MILLPSSSSSATIRPSWSKYGLEKTQRSRSAGRAEGIRSAMRCDSFQTSASAGGSVFLKRRKRITAGSLVPPGRTAAVVDSRNNIAIRRLEPQVTCPEATSCLASLLLLVPLLSGRGLAAIPGPGPRRPFRRDETELGLAKGRPAGRMAEGRRHRLGRAGRRGRQVDPLPPRARTRWSSLPRPATGKEHGVRSTRRSTATTSASTTARGPRPPSRTTRSSPSGPTATCTPGTRHRQEALGP